MAPTATPCCGPRPGRWPLPRGESCRGHAALWSGVVLHPVPGCGYLAVRAWTANSSLILKVPDRQLTFILLANTDGLSSPYPLGAGTLESSPWAREFLDAFVLGSASTGVRGRERDDLRR